MDAAFSIEDRPALTGEEVKTFAKRSDLHSWFAICCVYVFGAAIIIVTSRWPSVWTIVPGFLLIAGLQHNLSILQHEAVHYLLLKNRKLNDWVGNVLLSYPIGFTMHYRHIHFAHHSHLGEETDPDRVNYEPYPSTLAFFLSVFVKNITGMSAVKQSLAMAGIGKHEEDDHEEPEEQPKAAASRWHLVGIATAQLILLGIFTLLGNWWLYFVLWLFPLLTLAKTLTNMRNAVEHTAITDPTKPFARYRTILSPMGERFFLAPFNFNYHAEHHLYPGIPYYNLPKVHRTLAKQSAYHKYIQIIPGYLHFVRKYMVRGKKKPSESPLPQ